MLRRARASIHLDLVPRAKKLGPFHNEGKGQAFPVLPQYLGDETSKDEALVDGDLWWG